MTINRVENDRVENDRVANDRVANDRVVKSLYRVVSKNRFRVSLTSFRTGLRFSLSWSSN